MELLDVLAEDCAGFAWLMMMRHGEDLARRRPRGISREDRRDEQ